jgi:hypothetical protein
MTEAKYDGHILIHNKQGIHKHFTTFELSLSGLEWNVKKYWINCWLFSLCLYLMLKYIIQLLRHTY